MLFRSVAVLPKIASAIETRFKSKVIFSTNWNELISSISNNTKHLMLHIDAIKRSNLSVAECLSMLNNILICNDRKRDVKISVIITKTTEYNTVKICQKNKVVGIVPAILSWGLEEAFKGLDSISSGDFYYPKHIIDFLPGAPTNKKSFNADPVKLTLRQTEIFELISKRGLSNKQIAKMLSISESTVKIHVSAIFKTLCVRNRTQLALTKI